MNTVNVTCPVDGERFAVVEPEDVGRLASLTATCPSCDERFAIVYPDELQNQLSEKPTYEPYFGTVEEWEEHSDPPAPYTGSQEAIPFEQYIVAKIGGLGSVPDVEEMGQSHEEALKPDRFQFWYTPDHDEIAYVVRADLETGVKTKNVYDNQGGGLFVKNRGVPRGSDKQWTFLDRDECYARAAQARLEGEISSSPEKSGRFNVFLDNKKRPLINTDGELAEELVLELARMLVAFQTKRIK